MSCCDEDASQKPRTIEFADLPDETFACMGRMAYIIADACDHHLTGAIHADWYSLNELQKLRVGARAKALLINKATNISKIDELMLLILTKMMQSS